MTRARSGPAREVVLDAGDGGRPAIYIGEPRLPAAGTSASDGSTRPLARAGHGGGLHATTPSSANPDRRASTAKSSGSRSTGADTGPTTAIFTGTGARPDSRDGTYTFVVRRDGKLLGQRNVTYQRRR